MLGPRMRCCSRCWRGRRRTPAPTSSWPAPNWATRQRARQLFAGGQAAVDGLPDPFLVLARLLEPRSRELRRKYDNDVVAVERDAYAKIAQAVFAVRGDAAYPDGTFTLRLSYGQVKGYREEGTK